MSHIPIVAVSGGFDPIHKGHIELLKEAALLGRVYVILNSDMFLINKKGSFFMDFYERRAILESIRYVEKVIPCIDRDMTVCDTLRLIKPHFFANGGDRTSDNTPEKDVCAEIGTQMLYNIGGGKIQSSSNLLKKYASITE